MNTVNYTREYQPADWPQEGLESVRQCPACGSGERNKLYEGLTDRVFFCAPGRWTLFECQSCRSAYLDPRPTTETIHMAYKTYYTHTESKRALTENLRPMRHFVRALANGYRNQRYGSNLRPTSRLGGIVIRALPFYRQALDLELRYLPRVWEGARLLDVGFGNGSFMKLARRVGWIVAGVDPDQTAVENARKCGMEVFQGGIEALADHSERFDVITMNHVIEHVHEPVNTLKQAFGLLKPGGCLCLDTPNIEAAGYKEFGEHWRGLEVPRHLTIFTWIALKEILIQAGFGLITRRCRMDVYPRLAAKSRSIQNGKSPYEHNKVLVRDRLKVCIDIINRRADWRTSEFLTLIAYKPD